LKGRFNYNGNNILVSEVRTESKTILKSELFNVKNCSSAMQWLAGALVKYINKPLYSMTQVA